MQELRKTSSGIKGLDQLTGGGLPFGRSTRYAIEVIDLIERPQLAEGDQILAIPTLVRRLPEPIRKIIGDLSNSERVLIGLDIRPRSAA